MRRLTLAALIVMGTALPAMAYPTSVVNVPTAGVMPFKSYHLGLYNYLQPSLIPTSTSPYLGMASLAAGVLPFFDLAPGVAMGALEIGCDGLYPFPMANGLYPTYSTPLPSDPDDPLPILPHLKIGVLQETDWLPGIALGAYFFGVPEIFFGANVLHASVTKSFNAGDWDLGQYTLGLYHGNPVAFGPDANGWMAAYYRNLPWGTYVMGDFTSGRSKVGGLNLAAGYAINRNLSVTAGWFMASDRSLNQDKGYLFFDWVAELPI